LLIVFFEILGELIIYFPSFLKNISDLHSINVRYIIQTKKTLEKGAIGPDPDKISFLL